jgi:hypothetical protein
MVAATVRRSPYVSATGVDRSGEARVTILARLLLSLASAGCATSNVPEQDNAPQAELDGAAGQGSGDTTTEADDTALSNGDGATVSSDAMISEGTDVCLSANDALWGSCNRNDRTCDEPATAAGSNVLDDCDLTVGDALWTTSCRSYGVTGRCLSADGTAWRYHYGQTPAHWEPECIAEGGTFCAYAWKVTPELVETCRRACLDYRQQVSGACLSLEGCQSECRERLTFVSDQCATCLLDNAMWPAGGCGEWECICPALGFPTPDDARAGPCDDVCY